jgi:hypothetical protein
MIVACTATGGARPWPCDLPTWRATCAHPRGWGNPNLGDDKSRCSWNFRHKGRSRQGPASYDLTSAKLAAHLRWTSHPRRAIRRIRCSPPPVPLDSIVQRRYLHLYARRCVLLHFVCRDALWSDLGHGTWALMPLDHSRLQADLGKVYRLDCPRFSPRCLCRRLRL